MTKKKVVVVGNCQARPIATLLEEMSEDIEVTKVAIVHLLKNEQELEFAPFFEDADYIIAQLVNDNYPCSFVRTKYLEEKYKNKVIKIVNIYSKKYFQHWFNLKKGDTTLSGPLDTYHNEIIYNCWRENKSLKHTLDELIKSNNNDSKSLDNLKSRESNSDVHISDILESFDKNSFHIFNHPKNEIIELYVQRILIKIKSKIKDSNLSVKNEFLGKISIPEVQHYSQDSLFNGYDFLISEKGIEITNKKQYKTFDLIKAFFYLYDKIPPGQSIENIKNINIKNNVITIKEQRFLYQKNTGQRQFEHLMGNLKVSEKARRIFIENIKNNIELSNKYNIKYKHIIFPAKPFVFRETFKSEGIEIKSICNEETKFSQVIYPNLSESDYDSDDTHTNDQGVIKIINQILKDLNYNFRIEPKFSIGRKACDLGVMLGIPESNYLKLDSIFINGKEIKKQHVYKYSLDKYLNSNTGDLSYTINFESPIKETLVLFGDSFFKTRLHLFSSIFEDVIYIRNPYIMEDIIKTIKPDIILSGNAERYLINPPSSSTPRPYFMNYLAHGFKTPPSKDIITAFEALFSGRESDLFKNFKSRLKSEFSEEKIVYDEMKIQKNFYDRQDCNNQNSSFGQECNLIDIDTPDKEYTYHLGKTNIYGEVSEKNSKFCNEIKGNISHKVYKINDCDVFLPNGAIFIHSNNTLLKPSLWQSQLFFNSQFRNDKSTMWKWRVNKNYNAKKLPGKTLLLHNRAYKNYFHWIIDIISKIYLIDNLSSYDNIIIGLSKEHKYIDFFLEKFQIDSKKIIWTEEYEVYRCETLVAPYYKVTEDIGIRANYNDKEHYKGWCSEFLKSIKKDFKSPNNTEKKLPKKIFISRRNDNSRRILNIDEVSKLLIDYDFVEINPGELSIDEQIEIFNNATDIVAVHGAALTNIIWTEKSLRLIELMPNDYDDPGYRMIAGLMGINHHSILFCEAYNPNNTVFSDLIVDIKKLRELIDCTN